jgi:glycosyltransferase involved in cell wall biosynthesis
MSQIVPDVVLIEPVARCTGHQSWYFRQLYQALAAAGTTVLGLTYSGLHEDEDFHLGEQRCYRVSNEFPHFVGAFLSFLTGVDKFDPIRLTGGTRGLRARLYFQIVCALTLMWALKQARTNGWPVLHLLCPPSFLVLAVLLFYSSKSPTTIVTVYGSPHKYFGSRALLRWPRTYHRVRLICQTEHIALSWAKVIGNDRVFRIELPTENSGRAYAKATARIQLGLPLGCPIVGILGFLTAEKGYVEVLNAVAAMKAEVHVLFFGDAPRQLNPSPMDVARQLGIEERLILHLGFAPEADFAAAVAAVDVVALLYRDSSQSSGVLSWCVSRGVPVLATKHGALGVQVRDLAAGITVDPLDANETAAAIHRLLTEGAPACNGLRAGTDWAAAATSHQRLYRDVLNGI